MAKVPKVTLMVRRGKWPGEARPTRDVRKWPDTTHGRPSWKMMRRRTFWVHWEGPRVYKGAHPGGYYRAAISTRGGPLWTFGKKKRRMEQVWKDESF